MKLKIAEHDVELRSITFKGLTFDKEGRSNVYLTPLGKTLQRIEIGEKQVTWKEKESGKTYEPVSRYPPKSFKGKAFSGFKVTTETMAVVFDLKEERAFIKMPHVYQALGSSLTSECKELESKGKGLAFTLVVTAGEQRYRAVASYDKELDAVLVRCYQGRITKEMLRAKGKEIKVADENRVEAEEIVMEY